MQRQNHQMKQVSADIKAMDDQLDHCEEVHD